MADTSLYDKAAIKAKVRTHRETIICIDIATNELRRLADRLDKGGAFNQTIDVTGTFDKEAIIVRFIKPRNDETLNSGNDTYKP